jgi:hypothetical protein
MRFVAVVVCDRMRYRNRTAEQCSGPSSPEITEPLRPATKQVHQDSNPDQRGWSSPCYRLHHGPVKRTTRVERVSPGWRPVALPLELRPQRASGRNRTRTPTVQRACASVDTTEACVTAVETVGVEPTPSSVQARRPATSRPQVCCFADADGWSRTTTARGNAFTARRAHRCSASAKGGRPDSNRNREDHDLGCLPLHHGHHA